MSLAHHYTWARFLKENPEAKKKKLKRTSSEGEKAYKAAFKDFAKNYLKERQALLKKEQDRAEKQKADLVKKLKAVDGKKWHLKAKKLNQKIGRFDSYLSRLEKAQKHTTTLSKEI